MASLAQDLFIADGTAAASGRTITTDANDALKNEAVKGKFVFEFLDADARTLKLYKTGAVGKETKCGEIRYTKRQ